MQTLAEESLLRLLNQIDVIISRFKGLTKVTNKQIHKFSVEGQMASDSSIPSVKNNFYRLMLQDMRDKGYIPVLDINPGWYVHYDEPKDDWHFSLVLHGIYIGKKKSWQYEGIQDGKLLPRSTTRSKSQRS